jgi:IMP dehydrogenase
MEPKIVREGITFDDVLLVPSYSDVIPSEVKTRSFFARGVFLETPIISSAMDTVTESGLARVMAQLGGLGIIHKNLSVEDQAFEVEKVKKYEAGMITEPVTLPPEASVRQALELMKKYGISGFPVVQGSKVVGILTNRDLRFESTVDQPISNLMTKENLVTVPVGTTLQEAKKILQKHRIEKLLVVNDSGDLKGLITIKDIEKSQNYPQATKDSQGRLLVGAAVSVGTSAVERAQALVAKGCDVIVVDTAHGHSRNVLDTVKAIRQECPDKILVAGNVVTSEGTLALIEAGADVIKVGVGPGSICTTRVIAGVGMPQVSALMECYQVSSKRGATLIADGGIRYSGDIAKALVAGAHSVMIGNLLAGTEESPGETVLYQGRSYKMYRGMGSLGAMAQGSRDRYSQEDIYDEAKLVPEGIEGRVPFKGGASKVIHQLLGGLRASMGYLGVRSIEQLQEQAQMIRMTSNGVRESHVHDVSIVKEAPNYKADSIYG